MRDVDAMNIGGLYAYYKAIGLGGMAVKEVEAYRVKAGLTTEEIQDLADRADSRLREVKW